MQDGGEMKETVILFDGAGYHTTKETIQAAYAQGFQVIFSGPYSYDAAPCESVFAVLKQGIIRTASLSLGIK